jgi:hypothetical protein
VALVNNAGSSTVYYDGVAQDATGNFGNYDQTQDLYIGKRGNNAFQYFNGKLTNIRILDSAFYGSNFFPDQLPSVVAGHTKLLLRPTVDTIYGVDEGNLGLAISSSGATYSSDYAPVTHGLVARQYYNNGYDPNFGGANVAQILIADYPEAASVTTGAILTSSGPNGNTGPWTIAGANTVDGRRILYLSFPPPATTIWSGDTLTITWRT